MKKQLKSLFTKLSAPALRWFEHRFDRVEANQNAAEHSADLILGCQLENQESLAHSISMQLKASEIIGRTLASQTELLESVDLRLVDIDRATSLPLLGPEDLELVQLDRRGADYLNRALGWRGFSSAAGLFVNEAINHYYEPSRVSVLNINERIAELPFAFAEAAKIPVPARVLDVGSSESTFCLSLATLGYSVSAVDPRGYAFPHPNLVVQEIEISDFVVEEPFDLIVALSTIEHIGIGHYLSQEVDDADFKAMESLRRLSRPGTRLILTTPFGEASRDEVQRIYDTERLTSLLSGWEIEVATILQRASETEWNIIGNTIAETPKGEFAVAMISAVLSG